MLLQTPLTMKTGEYALRVGYAGKFKFVAVVIDADGGADESPLIEAGVSDTSLAAAVAAKKTVISCVATTTIKEIIYAFRNHSDTTVATWVDVGDFTCEVEDAILSEAAGNATADQWNDDAGTTNNYAKGPYPCLQWKNAAAYNGTRYAIRKRVPTAQVSKGACAIVAITGIPTQAGGCSAVTREILNDNGDVLFTVTGSDPSTAAELIYGDPTSSNSVSFGESVIVRDSCTDAALTTGSTLIHWQFEEFARPCMS